AGGLLVLGAVLALQARPGERAQAAPAKGVAPAALREPA
ncbi:MAG: hypothetical protein QOJ89_3335, partial [bacterium]